MSEIVFLSDMDICDNEMPVTAVNELNNEKPVTAELPETSADDMANVEDHHVVNGDSYASRTARTVTSTRHDNRELSIPRMLCHSGQEPLFLHRAKIQWPSRYLKLLSKLKSTRRRSHVFHEK